MSARHAVVLLTAVVLASPAAAFQDEALVVKQLKAELKAVAKAFKEAATGVEAVAKADLDVFDVSIATGQDPVAAAESLFADLAVHMEALFDEGQDAADGAAVQLNEALALLADGGSLSGIYPEALYAGHGGLLDTLRADVTKHWTRALTRLDRRVRKSLDKAEKSTGLAFGLQLDADGGLPFVLADENGSVAHDPEPGLDLVLSVGDPTQADDGRVWLSGRRTVGAVDVLLLLVRDDGSAVLGASDAGNDRRWTASFADLPEGNYLVIAQIETDEMASQVAVVGVR